MPSAVVLLAEGAEEMEFTIAVDVLRRAEVEVTVAGIDGMGAVTCSRGVKILPDKALADVVGEKFDIIIIPGGDGGAEKIAQSTLCGEMLRAQHGRTGNIGAICAGPKALIRHQIAEDKVVTSYPTFQKVFEDAGYKYSQERVAIDGHIITSRGPGTAVEFALACATVITGVDMAQKLGPGMLIQHSNPRD